MAGKKKEGIDGLKDTHGGKQREDRQIIGKTVFDPLTIDAKNVVTVIHLLPTPEDNVRHRAIASLELFGRKDVENLKLLQSHGILEFAFPLVFDPDFITRRFTLKLIGMLSSLGDFREEFLKIDDVLTIYMDILSQVAISQPNNICGELHKKETDAVIQEYSSLTLAQLSTEHHVASELLQIKNCVDILSKRITSADPDIEKNCLDIISHLLNDIHGIETFIESPSFNIKLILDLTMSSYPVIQALAIEVLKQLTSWCRDMRVLFAFRDAMGIETTLQILETKEWPDLYPGALDLLINVADSCDLCDYLKNSGCLKRLVDLLDSSEETASIEKILGVLARMSQSKKGHEALHSAEMEKRFSNYLESAHDNIQEPCCLGIANLGTYFPSVYLLLENRTIKLLSDITIDGKKNLRLRNLAAYALSILVSANKIAAEALLLNEDYKSLFIVLTDSSNLPVELCQNVIKIFIGFAGYHQFRTQVISESLISALMSCLPTRKEFSKDPSLQVDALECLSEYLIESTARTLFYDLEGTKIVLNCLRSRFASVREWAGHLVVIASQNKNFVKAFIFYGGLDWLLREKNTMHSMPSWQSAIETLFENYLPAKFAYTGRLDLQDITQEGFYVVLNPKTKFFILDNLIENMICPVAVTYIANFDIPKSDLEEKRKTPSEKSSQASVQEKEESQNLQKFMKGADRNSLEEYVWQGSLNSYPSVDYEETEKIKQSCSFVLSSYLPDPYLNEYLENLKKKIADEEEFLGDPAWHDIHPKLVRKRAKILAEFVAEELSGPDQDPVCGAHFKIAHINEMKYHLGTTVIPLGYIRAGDYLERALLFKVLADRIGFPCALVRGSFGRAWIEIAVPVINVEDPETGTYKEVSITLTAESEHTSETTVTYSSMNYGSGSSKDIRCPEFDGPGEDFWFPSLRLESYKVFPRNFLKPNAIVDLVKEPGRIININSLEAEEYCGSFLFSQS